MIPIPAKVLTVDKQSSQYRVLVQIELKKYLGSFHTLRFGERKPLPAPVTTECWTFFTTEIPVLNWGSRFRCGRLCDFSHASAITLPFAIPQC
jgi:hypothetical protein